MSLTYEFTFSCPYCMAPNSLEIDPVYDLEQQQIIDCQVCCQSIELLVREGAMGEFEIEARTDDE